ncbi:MAG: hypothetical protein KIH01_04585 [Candidatus Freyarchaeota archaeon]|nr:hypothetical protein [Candidatus Jordarchaeia archaeon]
MLKFIWDEECCSRDRVVGRTGERHTAGRISLLLEELDGLVRSAAAIVKGTFFEYVLRWYLLGMPDVDEAVRKIRDLVLYYCRVALRLTYLLQDLSSFIVTGREKREIANLLRAELELLTGEVDEAFIVAASRINEFERLFDAVGLLETSRQLLVDAVMEWERVKRESVSVLYSALSGEAEVKDAVLSLDACRCFISKFVNLFDLVRIRYKDEENSRFLRRMDEVGEFLLDLFWMAAIAGYHAARGIEVLVGDLQGEEAGEAMRRICEGEEIRWVPPREVDADQVAFSLIRVRHEVEDTLSAVERAIEMTEKASSLIGDSDSKVRIKVLEVCSKLREWRREASKVLEDVLDFQSVIGGGRGKIAQRGR